MKNPIEELKMHAATYAAGLRSNAKALREGAAKVICDGPEFFIGIADERDALAQSVEEAIAAIGNPADWLSPEQAKALRGGLQKACAILHAVACEDINDVETEICEPLEALEEILAKTATTETAL